MASQPLGYRGHQVLDLIKQRVERKGEAPSYRAIADALDVTVPDVCNVIRRLEQRGLLQRRAVGVRKNRGWHKSVIELTGGRDSF